MRLGGALNTPGLGKGAGGKSPGWGWRPVREEAPRVGTSGREEEKGYLEVQEEVALAGVLEEGSQGKTWRWTWGRARRSAWWWPWS